MSHRITVHIKVAPGAFKVTIQNIPNTMIRLSIIDWLVLRFASLDCLRQAMHRDKAEYIIL